MSPQGLWRDEPGVDVGAILRAHPHEPLAEHHGSGPVPPTGVDHPRRVELIALGGVAAIGGFSILIGGWLAWASPAGSLPWLFGGLQSFGPWNFWSGVGCGGLLVLLGLALARWPEHHAPLGGMMVVAGALSLLAGPLLWVGFLLGILAGVVAIVVGSPASPKIYLYTPMHVSMPPPALGRAMPVPPGAAPAAAVPPGRFCQKCGRSVSSGAEFCPWCGASQAPASA